MARLEKRRLLPGWSLTPTVRRNATIAILGWDTSLGVRPRYACVGPRALFHRWCDPMLPAIGTAGGVAACRSIRSRSKEAEGGWSTRFLAFLI